MYCMYIRFRPSRLSFSLSLFMFLHLLTSDMSTSSFASYDAKIYDHSVVLGGICVCGWGGGGAGSGAV